MSKILVLGGYGGFGHRISRRLAEAGHDVLVAGRSLAKAQLACRDAPGLMPVQLDRRDVADALAHLNPAILVDASGPFQGMDYGVPAACIAAGVHYCDIADATDFVCGIRALDTPAKDADVVLLSGASSVPALSGAAVSELASGIQRITAVEIAISASNRATAGPAVADAILRQVGKPMMLWRGKRRVPAFGWQEPETLSFKAKTARSICRRSVALVNVPDVELWPAHLPGRPLCVFKAGTELTFQNWALWLASWLVRWRIVAGLRKLTPVLKRCQALTSRLGSDRSAMIVRLFGFRGGKKAARSWTLIADRGDGPEIPCLSVPLIVDRILSGKEVAGARDASRSLRLEDYRSAFQRLAITTEIEELEVPRSAYQTVMGNRFDCLPTSLQVLHSPFRDAAAEGEAIVQGPTNVVARTIRALMAFPPPGKHKLHVAFREKDGVERWTRSFGAHSFSSELREKRGKLQERFGPLRFNFDLPSDRQGLQMVMRGWSAFGIPLPLRAAPRSRAREWDENGVFHFDVPIAVPIIGSIVHYRGWLRPL